MPAQRKTTKYPIALFNPPSHDGGYHSAYPRSRARKGAENQIETEATKSAWSTARRARSARPTLSPRLSASAVKNRPRGFRRSGKCVAATTEPGSYRLPIQKSVWKLMPKILSQVGQKFWTLFVGCLSGVWINALRLWGKNWTRYSGVRCPSTDFVSIGGTTSTSSKIGRG